MRPNDILANRLLHVVFLTLVAVALLGMSDPFPTAYRATFALAPLVTWILGKYYQRAIILQAELVDEEVLKEVEQSKARLLFRT